MRLLWNRLFGEVTGESALFADCDEIRLMFPAQSVQQVYCSMTGQFFQAGKDYIHVPGSNKLSRPSGSRIPKLTGSDLHPSGERLRLYPGVARGEENAIDGGVDGRPLIFNNRNFFALHQIEVDYTSQHIDFNAAVDIPGRLLGIQAKLAAAAPVRITWLGDSISEGYNSSGYLKLPPNQPPFAELTAEHLRSRFGGPVELHNCAVNGTGSAYPLQHREKWMNDRPDLLVIAYGMNDFASCAVDRYLANLAEIIELNRAASPATEYLLAASMSGNPIWKHTPPQTAARFAFELRNLAENAEPEVGFIDLHAIWNKFLARKQFLDLTGNGVNHPNDYGHRILASGILSALDKQQTYF
jgi:acyl-CoA thioesterase-1